MVGLLRKDFYYIRDYGRAYLPLLLIFCLAPGALGGAYALTLALAMPRSTIASDEIRWDRMAVMLPCRAEAVVGGKYLLCGLCVAVGTVLSALSVMGQQAAASFLAARGMETAALWPMSWLEALEYAVIQGGFALLIAALTVPLFYRFTARKGAVWANILVICLLNVTGVWSFNSLYSAPVEAKVLAVALLTGLALAACAASCALSIRFYRRRLRGNYD